MSETTATPALNEALAKLQASLPRIGKGETAKIPGKEGKQGYSYKYADLADVSQAVMPLLGKVGLAVTARPTLHDGSFALVYKLTHTSGDEMEGVYPLPSPENYGPQVIGSAITYARRYCLCAVVGVHPDGEDDDAARAQTTPYSAGEAWESATPARPRANGQRSGNGQHANGNSQQAPARQSMKPQPPLDPADAWALKIEAFSAAEDAQAAESELNAAYKAEEIDQARANQVLYAIRQKAGTLTAAAPDPTSGPQQDTGSPPSSPASGEPAEDAAWVADFLTSVGNAQSSMALDGLRPRIGQAVVDRKIATATAPELLAEITKRRRELQGATA